MLQPVRRQILLLVEAALREAQTDAGERVHRERMDLIEARDCPAITVGYAPNVESVEQLLLNGMQTRTLSLIVGAGIASEAQDHGDKLDQLVCQVEKTLGAELAHAGASMQQVIEMCAGGSELRGVRWDTSGEGEKAIAVCSQTWLFTYHVHQAQPDVAIT